MSNRENKNQLSREGDTDHLAVTVKICQIGVPRGDQFGDALDPALGLADVTPELTVECLRASWGLRDPGRLAVDAKERVAYEKPVDAW